MLFWKFLPFFAATLLPAKLGVAVERKLSEGRDYAGDEEYTLPREYTDYADLLEEQHSPSRAKPRGDYNDNSHFGRLGTRGESQKPLDRNTKDIGWNKKNNYWAGVETYFEGAAATTHRGGVPANNKPTKPPNNKERKPREQNTHLHTLYNTNNTATTVPTIIQQTHPIIIPQQIKTTTTDDHLCQAEFRLETFSQDCGVSSSSSGGMMGVMGGGSVGGLNEYGMKDPMMTGGLRAMKGGLERQHPLQLSEESLARRELAMSLRVLRDVQGLHAPLRLGAELKACSRVGRLPFLQSSELASATIMDRDDDLKFEDILNPIDLHEKTVLPHVIMEKTLKF